MPIMEIVREIRKLAGLEPYQMSKEMKMSIQAYQYLENEAQSINLKNLVELKKIACDHCGMSLSIFWDKLEKQAKKLKR